MRMNGEEFTKEGNTLEQTVRIARRMAKMGVDYISVSAGERSRRCDTAPGGISSSRDRLQRLSHESPLVEPGWCTCIPGRCNQESAEKQRL